MKSDVILPQKSPKNPCSPKEVAKQNVKHKTRVIISISILKESRRDRIIFFFK